MSKLARTHPDPAPIREALRGVRYVLRGVTASLRDIPAPNLPGPAGDIVDRAARGVGALTSEVDAAASNLARKVLGGEHHSAVQLPDAVDSAAFASALYWGLQRFFDRFEVPGQFVSELAGRTAYEQVMQGEPGSIGALTCRLIDGKVIRGMPPLAISAMAGDEVRPVAVFSALLWLQSDRPEQDDEAALLAAQDIAVALRGDIARACSAHDHDVLNRLYHDFASHI